MTNKDNNIQFPLRLVRYLAQAGVASRRKSFDIIQSGKVKVNNRTVTEPSSFINESDSIKVNNKTIFPSSFVYIMLNKPASYVCTNSDPYAAKKAIDLINLPKYRLFSAGRLDKDSEGLIIFTNDGKFSDKLMHPSNNILKIYEVTVKYKLLRTKIDDILNGINDSGETLKAVSIKAVTSKKYIFTLNEGKKREIRRLVKYANSEVTRLKRLSIGNLELGNLPSGKWKYISPEKIRKT
jgi:23S rRNA pseudouridine2605 synthase